MDLIDSGTLFITGDCIAQLGVEQVKEYNLARSARLGIFGSMIVGPSMVHWYRFLSAKVHLSSPLKTLFARVGLDQFVFSPVFLIVFFTANGLMEGKTLAQCKAKLEKGYVTALTANWTIWPWVQLANFKFVPLNYQALFVNSIALGWNTYLSLLNKTSG